MKRTFPSILLFLLPFLAAAQSPQEAGRSADADLRDALERLSALRAEIRDEKIPLAREVSDLERQLRDKRREVDRVQRRRDTQRIDLNQVEEGLRLRQDEIDYVSNLVAEFTRILDSRKDISERRLYSERLEPLLLAGEEDLSRQQRLMRMRGATGLGIDRMERLIGGYTFEGRAVSPGGRVEDGSFLLIGPLVYFASSETEGAGLALDLGAVDPNYFPLGGVFDAQIHDLVATGRGRGPVDPTLGDAFALEEVRETLWEHIQKGGIWIWPILAFAFLAFATALFKVFEIYTVKMPPPGTLHELLRLIDEGKKEEALAYAQKVPGPVGKMLVDGVLHIDEPVELIEEVLYERMLEIQPRLERLLPFIAVTAATAPLMGLLGTVTGMINTFKLITVFGTGDAKNLSSGISEALVTTEFGLIVAIPSLIMHALLSRRAQGVMANMERMGVAFVNGLTRRGNGSPPKA
ncbi:MAG: MotA/TolQ/ExbB proton channel family protein [Opitutales bacterium]|nr:MotA/TolQ/ExbB proton channel family protein [Opitutales bacterium]